MVLVPYLPSCARSTSHARKIADVILTTIFILPRVHAWFEERHYYPNFENYSTFIKKQSSKTFVIVWYREHAVIFMRGFTISVTEPQLSIEKEGGQCVIPHRVRSTKKRIMAFICWERTESMYQLLVAFHSSKFTSASCGKDLFVWCNVEYFTPFSQRGSTLPCPEGTIVELVVECNSEPLHPLFYL